MSRKTRRAAGHNGSDEGDTHSGHPVGDDDVGGEGRAGNGGTEGEEAGFAFPDDVHDGGDPEHVERRDSVCREDDDDEHVNDDGGGHQRDGESAPRAAGGQGAVKKDGGDKAEEDGGAEEEDEVSGAGPGSDVIDVEAGARGDGAEPAVPTDLSEYMPIDAVLRLKPLFNDPLIDEGIVAYFMDLPERMLLTPLVTDAAGTTLLGESNQQEACRRLHAKDAALLQSQFPQGLWITRRPYNAAEDPLRAFSDAIADSRGRHEMKPADVKNIMKQMIDAGLVPKRGHQKKGTEPAIPFFAKLFRYSETQIKRFRRAARPGSKPTAQIDQMTQLGRFKMAIQNWTPKLAGAPDAVRQHLEGLRAALAAAVPAPQRKAKATKKAPAVETTVAAVAEVTTPPGSPVGESKVTSATSSAATNPPSVTSEEPDPSVPMGETEAQPKEPPLLIAQNTKRASDGFDGFDIPLPIKVSRSSLPELSEAEFKIPPPINIKSTATSTPPKKIRRGGSQPATPLTMTTKE